MPITVVGSIAFDAVKTPFGERERMLGGAAVHFALAASFFDQVRVVGPVGEDFGEAELDVLRAREVDISDIERVEGGRTFFWRGEYGWDLNTRDTLDTRLGVFEGFQPKLSDSSRSSEVLFLAKRKGVRIAEVPVVWRNSAPTKVMAVRSSLDMFRHVIKVRFGRGTPVAGAP